MKKSGGGGRIQGQLCGGEERRQWGGCGLILSAGRDKSSDLFPGQSEEGGTAVPDGGDGDGFGWYMVDLDLGRPCKKSSRFEEGGGGGEGDEDQERDSGQMRCSWGSNSSRNTRWRLHWDGSGGAAGGGEKP